MGQLGQITKPLLWKPKPSRDRNQGTESSTIKIRYPDFLCFSLSNVPHSAARSKCLSYEIHVTWLIIHILHASLHPSHILHVTTIVQPVGIAIAVNKRTGLGTRPTACMASVDTYLFSGIYIRTYNALQWTPCTMATVQSIHVSPCSHNHAGVAVHSYITAAVWSLCKYTSVAMGCGERGGRGGHHWSLLTTYICYILQYPHTYVCTPL